MAGEPVVERIDRAEERAWRGFAARIKAGADED